MGSDVVRAFWGSERTYLYVDVGSTVHQEFQTQGTVGGRSCKVERRKALVIRLTDVGAVIDQLADHSVLSIKTCYVESCVPKGIRFIYL